MKRSKLISFKIDPNLERMWRAIGLSKTDRETEIEKLEDRLIECYKAFVSEVTALFEEKREELRRHQEEYRERQQVFGDKEHPLPVNTSLPFQEQIELTKDAMENLLHAYDERLEEFEKVHGVLSRLFDELGVENRGEFAEIGTEDLSLERLKRFNDMVKSLQEDKGKRFGLFESLRKRIEELLDELNEDVSAEVREILDTKTITNESIQLLHDTVDLLEDMRKQRLAEMDDLNEKIEGMYSSLAVDPSDRMQKPMGCTQEALELMKSEVEFLSEQKETRLPQVIRGLNSEIVKLCEQQKIPARMWPRYQGSKDDPEEEAVWLRKQLDRLQQRQIAAKPILTLISQIEALKEVIEGKNLAGRSGRKFLEEERERKKAMEQLPRLEKKLLELLVDFKDKNGYDFEFNGINYSKNYETPAAQEPQGAERRAERGTERGTERRAERRTERGVERRTERMPERRVERRETIGQQLLAQMINESKAMGSEIHATKNARQRRQSNKARSLFI